MKRWVKKAGSFGGGDDAHQSPSARTRHLSVQYSSFKEETGYEDDFDDDDDVEKAQAVVNPVMGRNFGQEEEEPLEELEMMTKTTANTHSIYDFNEVSGDLEEVRREEEHGLRWLDLVRMSEMAFEQQGNAPDYYAEQDAAIAAAEEEGEVEEEVV